MRIEQLEYLMAVIRHGSLRRAGEQLHLSQPALSESVRNLERELGVTLLERRRTGTRVSREGRDLLPSILDVIEAVDRLRTAADDRDPPARGVRVATVGSGAPSLLARAVRDVREERRALAVQVTSGALRDVAAALVAGDLDLALVDARPGDPVPSEVAAVELARGRLAVACLPDHAFARQGEVRVRQLQAEAIVTSAALPGVHDSPGPHGDQLAVATLETTDGAGTATSLVAHGAGVAVLPDYCLREDPLVRVGAITHRPVDGDRVAVSLLCLHRRGALPAAAAALRERLLDHARG